MKKGDVLNGFVKGLATIEAFSGASSERLSITDVSKLTGHDRATTRRCLLTLCETGYMSFDGKFFSLTPKVLRLGYSYLSSARLPTLVQPFLEQLLDLTGQPASAVVLDGLDAVHIARASHRRVMSFNLSPGTRIPAYCSASGRVLLASMTDEEAEALIASMDRRPLTPETITDVAKIMEQIRSVRDRGYATVDGELEIGLCALAVPVADRRGKTIAGLNLGAHSYLTSMETMVQEYLPHMLKVRDSLQEIMP